MRCRRLHGRGRTSVPSYTDVKRDSILMEFSGGGQVTGKVWGFTQACLITPLVELHRIVVRPHMHCSLHLHERAWNAFVVTAGVLHIDVHKADYNLVDTTTLGPGGVTTVAPGEKHQFRTGPEGAEAYELYYLEPLGPDIKRDCEGGANE